MARKVIDDKGYQKKDDRSAEAGNESVCPPKLTDTFPACDGDEGRSPARRMERFAYVHDGYGCGYGKAGRKPCDIGYHHAGTDADERRKEMPAHHVPGLGQRAVHSSEGKNCGCAERAYEQRAAPGHMPLKQRDKADGDTASCPCRGYFSAGRPGRTFPSAGHFLKERSHTNSRFQTPRGKESGLHASLLTAY